MFISSCATQPGPFLLSIWELSIIYMNLGVIDSCCTSTYLAGYMLVWKTHDESRLYVEVGMYQITGILVFLPRNLSRRSCNKNFTLKVKFLFTIQINVIRKKWSPTYRGVLTDLISILFCFSSWFSRKPSRKQKAIIKNLLLSHIVNIRRQLTGRGTFTCANIYLIMQDIIQHEGFIPHNAYSNLCWGVLPFGSLLRLKGRFININKCYLSNILFFHLQYLTSTELQMCFWYEYTLEDCV